MDEVALFRGPLLIGCFALGPWPLEVGRGGSCDIVVDDADLPLRLWLLLPAGAVWQAHDLRGGARSRRRPRALPLDRRVAVGRHHHLVRRRRAPTAASAGSAASDGDTLGVGSPTPVAPLRLLVGQAGSEPRGYAIRAPLQIGRAADNALVLGDPRVSGHHCRVEPLVAGGCLLRDLDSRNGTWVDGVRVQRATVMGGTRLRVGDTDLRLVAAPDAPPATLARDGIVACSAAMQALLCEVRAAAGLPWPVLVSGESGSGKEGVAAALHRWGSRAAGPWVTLNAGGLAPSLVESELFGHERGAFTGADAARRGVFEQAHGGTLFLDEIGELPLSLQARLLRVLESGEVRRVGTERVRRVDVRLVCATHRDLRDMVATGDFREDLYYRLARVVLSVPPLRERTEDVLALCEHFLPEIAAAVGPCRVDDRAQRVLLAHDWPGNARELRNVLSSAAAATPGPVLGARDVARAIERVGGGLGPAAADVRELHAAVQAHRGNLAAAARALGVPRTTLRDRMRKRSAS